MAGLEKLAPFYQRSVIPLLILNPIHHHSKKIAAGLRFFCYFTSGEDSIVKIWLLYIGKPDKQKEPLDRAKNKSHLSALLEAWKASHNFKESLVDIRKELVQAMARLAGRIRVMEVERGKMPNPSFSTQLMFAWRNKNKLEETVTLLDETHSALSPSDDEDILNTNRLIGNDLSDLKNILKAVRVSEKTLAGIVIHGCFWMVLILLYPRSRMIQAIFFWNPWVRRILGFPYMGLLLMWVPFLRRRLLAPFRESLVRREVSEGFNGQYWYGKSRIRNIRTGKTENLRQAIPSLIGEIVLQGASGLGKTMLLKLLVNRTSKTRINVFLNAEECSQYQGGGSSEKKGEVFGSVIEAISDRLFGYAQDNKFLRNLIYSGALDIYIDGLSEVSADTRSGITAFMNRYYKGNIIVTTQPLLKWNSPGNAAVYELLPLEKGQIQEFLHRREGALLDDALITGKDYKDACTAYLKKALARADSSVGSGERQQDIPIALSNPMDLTIVSELIACGVEPDLFRLQDHQYKLMAKDFKKEAENREFPLAPFSDTVFEMRKNNASKIPSEGFEDGLKCLFKHKMVLHRRSQTKDGKEEDVYTFRHDKIMEYFIVQTFFGRENERLLDYIDDPRFKGVYLLLALLMPEEEAQILREELIDYATHSGDHYVSDDFIKLFKGRKQHSAKGKN